MTATKSTVTAVSKSAGHTFSKPNCPVIELRTGIGVTGDAHAGATVQHVSRLAKHDHEPNLRQIHLIHAELHDELNAAGFSITPGQMGENITTRGIELLNLPRGARLHFSGGPIVEVTGLRSPCSQLDDFQKGLTAAVLDRDADGNLIRKSGVMGIVVTGGEIKPGDSIELVLPDTPHQPLIPV